MKKTFALIFIFVLTITAFSGCKGQTIIENTFFSDETLKEYMLEGLPEPKLARSRMDPFQNTLYLNLTMEEYETYARTVYDFIKNKTDLYYQGYIFGQYLIAEIAPAYEVTDVYSNYDYQKDSNGFSYSIEIVETDENEVNTHIELKNSKQVFIERSGGELKGGFQYNTKMYFKSRTSSFKKCGVEHTYKEGKEFPVAGTKETKKVYNCIYCDSVKVESDPSDFYDKNTYKMNVIKGKEFLKNNLSEKTYSGVIVSIKTNIIYDADIAVRVNGTIIPLDNWDSEYNVFSFIMPHADVNIEIYIEGGM